MSRIVTIIYIVMAVIGMCRVPGLLLRKKNRRAKDIGQLVPRSIYLIIRDKRVRKYYLITDIYSDYKCGHRFQNLMIWENDKLFMKCSHAKLMTINSSNPFLYEPCVHFVKLVDLPRDVMKYMYRRWIATDVLFQATTLVYNFHFPSDEDRERLWTGQKIFDNGIR